MHVSDPTALENFKSKGYRVERVSNVRAEDLVESAIDQFEDSLGGLFDYPLRVLLITEEKDEKYPKVSYIIPTVYMFIQNQQHSE